MKVAYLLGSLNRGGAETLLLDVFNNASKASYEMIGIHRKDGPYREEFYSTGRKMIQCAPKRFGLLRYLWLLRSIIMQEQATVIHSQNWLDAVYAWFATIGLHIPIVLTFHGYLGAEAKGISAIMYRSAIRMADKLCYVSGYQMEQYVARYGEIVRKKGCVVYNGIDFGKFDVVKGEGIRGLEDERLKLCMVGSFNSVRNQFAVLEALAKVKGLEDERMRGFDFYFIGARYKGEEWRYDECVKYCEEKGLKHVHFLGSRGDIPALLRQMDGFVYATKNDTFGIAVVEAMAAGLTVVVNDHPVMKEVCGEAGDTVRYYRTDDAEDAAAAIEALLTNMRQSKSAAKENAKRVRQKYNIENHIGQLHSIYQSL